MASQSAPLSIAFGLGNSSIRRDEHHSKSSVHLSCIQLWKIQCYSITLPTLFWQAGVTMMMYSMPHNTTIWWIVPLLIAHADPFHSLLSVYHSVKDHLRLSYIGCLWISKQAKLEIPIPRNILHFKNVDIIWCTILKSVCFSVKSNE